MLRYSQDSHTVGSVTDQTTLDRVRKLIRAQGVTQGEFAESVGLDASKLSKSLAGVRRFTSLDLARIATRCDTTVDALLGADTTRQIAARSATPVKPGAVDHAIAEASRYAEARANLAFLNGPGPARARFSPESGKATVQGQILADSALQMLSSSSLLDRRDLAAVIEKTFNIDVAIVELPHGFDGLAWSDADAALILVGTSRQPGRQRFTMAHELGHLLVGDNRDLHVDEDVYDPMHRRDIAEMRANAFAAAFLMPEAVLHEALSGRHPERADVAVLSCRLSVSPASLAWRLFNLGIIDDTERARFGSMTALAAATEAGRAADFASWIDETARLRRPARIVDEALQTFMAGKSTLRPVAALMDIPLDDLRSAVEDSLDNPIPTG